MFIIKILLHHAKENCFPLVLDTVQQLSSMKNLVFSLSQRGTPKLIMHGYSFLRNKGNSHTTYWRCSKMRTKVRCLAKILTNRQKDTILFRNIQHNHPPDCSEFAE